MHSIKRGLGLGMMAVIVTLAGGCSAIAGGPARYELAARPTPGSVRVWVEADGTWVPLDRSQARLAAPCVVEVRDGDAEHVRVTYDQAPGLSCPATRDRQPTGAPQHASARRGPDRS